MTPRERHLQPMDGLRIGANKDGFVSPEQVHLVVSLQDDGARLAGPGTRDMEWVVHVLNGLAKQWQHQEPMPEVGPPTAGTEPDGNWVDCTESDVTVIFYRDCQVISMPGEVFGDGLAQYTLDIVGRRRHDDDYCTDRFLALAAAVSEDIESGDIPAREDDDGC